MKILSSEEVINKNFKGIKRRRDICQPDGGQTP